MSTPTCINTWKTTLNKSIAGRHLFLKTNEPKWSSICSWLSIRFWSFWTSKASNRLLWQTNSSRLTQPRNLLMSYCKKQSQQCVNSEIWNDHVKVCLNSTTDCMCWIYFRCFFSYSSVWNLSLHIRQNTTLAILSRACVALIVSILTRW